MADRVGQQLGNYRLIRLLGQGGFAEVYLGEQIYLKTQVAIKLLQMQLANEDIEGFLKEARTVASLVHPHIVRVIDFGIEGETPFLVMDYAPNGTLRQRYPKGARLPLDTVVSYVKQVASALQYAHNMGLVHRDIKPENMLLSQNNEVLLSDFGYVLIAQSSISQSTKEIAGTIPYMAPEQFHGKPRFASDQYSLGIVVYEWLTGDRPFQGSVLEIAAQHMLNPPPPVRTKNPAIPAQVEEVLLTALAKEPQQRFATVQAFGNALQQVFFLTQQPAQPVALDRQSVRRADLSPAPASTTPPNAQALPTRVSNPPSSRPPLTPPTTVTEYSSTPPSIRKDRYSKPVSLLKRAFSGLTRMTGRRIKESQLSLFAIARANLEVGDRAYVNQTYFIEAGISGSKPANFRAEPFDISVSDPTLPLAFSILIHVSDNIELQDEWHKGITYYPFSPATQLVRFMFKVAAAGHSSISIDFYHKQRWLRTVRLEFEAVEQSQLSTASSRV